MKKTIALVLLLILAIGVFAACNQTQPTEKKARWENNESWTYNISLINLNDSLTTTKGTYFRDFLATGETSPMQGNADRLVPDALEGQYIVNLTVDATKGLATVSTTQTLLATYSKTNVADTTQFGELVVSQDEASVTLKSTTQTTVVFKNNTAQTPVSSKTVVDGFYIGKQHQAVSKYSLSTEYEIGKKNTVAKVTLDGETTEVEITGTNVIDNNQVLWYVRSFDKTSTSFQDNPQVMVFDALAQKARVMTLRYTASQNTLIRHTYAGATEATPVAATLDRLDVSLDGAAYLTQVNLPDLTAKHLDRVGSAEAFNTYFPKHTICRFRVGFATYELVNYLTNAMVEAVKVAEA